jgi:alanyl-tRNA synthetase
MLREISSKELRELYLAFFESKGHVRIPSVPLVPENDPSVLFTTAGMHPLVPYLKGQHHPLGKRLASVQKCLRTTDIEAVGDAAHATVFEMLGNWSLGDYFKDEAITWSWEFLTGSRWLAIDPTLLAVSVFGGDQTASRDVTSYRTWQAAGVAKERIAFLGKEANWWPAGGKATGPQGPDTEMFYWSDATARPPREFDPADARWVEIWNDVFMEFDGDGSGALTRLPQTNVDTGMGLERVVMVLRGAQSIYDIDTFQPLVSLIRSSAQRADNETALRIVADHIKATAFILGDEIPVAPGPTDQGYVLRRLIRRAMRFAKSLGFNEPLELMREGVQLIIHEYEDVYPSLRRHEKLALTNLSEEIERFQKTLGRGLKEFGRLTLQSRYITGAQASALASTHGFPVEMTKELAVEQNIRLAPDFDQEFARDQRRHQELSRTAAAGKFKGGLADHSEQSVRFHTATHLLHQALREVLGNHVVQKGSNITPERLRFDFSHERKLTASEIAAVEALVNRVIATNLPVIREEMTVAAAKERGALGLFEDKYADRVSVYMIGGFSIEICGGPHVSSTGQLGTFRITAEESVGAGRRRIKAVLE